MDGSTSLSMATSLLDPLTGYSTNSIYLYGTQINGFYPTGVPDGLGAYKTGRKQLRLLVNSEIGPTAGYSYSLANGVQLTGARVNFLDINTNNDAVTGAGIAYDKIYNRLGQLVTSADMLIQEKPGDAQITGFNRFCSANFVAANTFGKGRGARESFFLIGEESGAYSTMQVLDPSTGTLYAAPDLGYGGWESGQLLDTGTKNKVAVILGDDNSNAPIYLYVGEKLKGKGENDDDDDDRKGGGKSKNAKAPNFLERNGLSGGQLYVWVANQGATTSGSLAERSTTSGTWKPINARDASKAGQSGYDAQGYKYADTLRAQAKAMGAFIGYRIEDVDVNPNNPSQAVFNTTGGQVGGDYYGSTWTIDTSFDRSGKPTTGSLFHVYDGDAPGHLADGIRSQDNVAWSKDGYLYINEDKSITEAAFGTQEASVWQLDPLTGDTNRIAQVNRAGTLPAGVTDSLAANIGDWETSGIIDVSQFYGHAPGTDFFTTVQAHGTGNGIISTLGLAESGSIVHITASPL